MNKQTMWILVVAALIVGAFGGYLYEKSKLTKLMMVSETSMQKQIDDAKMKNEELMKDQSTETDKMMQVSPEPSGAMMQKTVVPSGAMMQK